MPPAVLPTPADVVARTLYTYVSSTAGDGVPMDQSFVVHRGLYVYVSSIAYGHPLGGEPLDQDDVLARALYACVSLVHGQTPEDVAARALYDYEAYTNDEVFPWIERIVPNEQLPGGQVAVHGDGFGANPAAEGGSVRIGMVDPLVPGPGLAMGVVSWLARSPNLWPANGVGDGVTNPPLTDAAIVVTVPDEAESGMVVVEETI